MSDGWEVVETVGTEEEAALIAGFLESQGIPTTIESLLFHQEPVNFGRLGEIRIQVPAGRREEAERLLAERQAAAPSPEGGEEAEEEGAAPGEEEPTP